MLKKNYEFKNVLTKGKYYGGKQIEIFVLKTNANEFDYKLLEEKMARLINKNQELKKQLEDISEELELVRCDLHNRTSERDGYERELNECLSQQKEFIKWLENGIEKVKNTEFFDERIQKAGLIAYNRVLSKYKEIIGGKE